MTLEAFVEEHADGADIPNLDDVPVAINDIGEDGLQLALQTQIVRINDVESDTEIRSWNRRRRCSEFRGWPTKDPARLGTRWRRHGRG